jgi:hypothetical protein
MLNSRKSINDAFKEYIGKVDLHEGAFNILTDHTINAQKDLILGLDKKFISQKQMILTMYVFHKVWTQIMTDTFNHDVNKRHFTEEDIKWSDECAVQCAKTFKDTIIMEVAERHKNKEGKKDNNIQNELKNFLNDKGLTGSAVMVDPHDPTSLDRAINKIMEDILRENPEYRNLNIDFREIIKRKILSSISKGFLDQ